MRNIGLSTESCVGFINNELYSSFSLNHQLRWIANLLILLKTVFTKSADIIESHPYESFKSYKKWYDKSNEGSFYKLRSGNDIMNCELDEKDIGCLYLEVQFTRDTVLLIPKTSYMYIIIRLL